MGFLAANNPISHAVRTALFRLVDIVDNIDPITRSLIVDCSPVLDRYFWEGRSKISDRNFDPGERAKHHAELAQKYNWHGNPPKCAPIDMVPSWYIPKNERIYVR